MRSLKIAKLPTPAQYAEAAAARRWLESQPVPQGLSAAEYAARFRYVVAVARQYRKSDLGILELVEAGWRAGQFAGTLWDWRVREAVLEALMG